MTKRPTISSVLSGWFSSTTMDTNFSAIMSAFDNTLSRDGSTPNAMGADLDLNSNDLLNARSVAADSFLLSGQALTLSATALTASQTAKLGYDARSNASATAAAALADGTKFQMAGIWYEVDSTKTGTASVTNDLGVNGVKHFGPCFPEHFGCAGDGSTDDSTKFQAFADYCKSNYLFMDLFPGKNYKLSTSGVWVGKDDASLGCRGIRGNGAYITPGFSNKPVFDLFGIKNFEQFIVRDLNISSTDSSVVPTCAFAMGRPKQSSGVVSSGNAFFQNVIVDGYFSIGVVYNVQSESNTFLNCVFFQYHPTGHAMALCKHDMYEGCVNLNVDSVSALFSDTETVTGATSGATAKIIRPMVVDNTGAPTSGDVWLQITSGTFVDNEQITGGTSGSTANINAPSGYNVIPKASTNTALGVEETSTSSYNIILNCYLNRVNAVSDNLYHSDGVLFLSDVVDIIVTGTNFNDNINTDDGIHILVQQDQTVDSSKGAGISGITTRDNFHHSKHQCHFAVGDPCTAVNTATYEGISFGPNLSTGNTSTVDAAFKFIGGAVPSAFADINIDTDFGINFEGTKVTGGGNEFRIRDRGNGSFKYNQEIEGTLYCDTANTITGRGVVGAGQDRLRVVYGDSGLVDEPPAPIVPILSGIASVGRSIGILRAETGTTDDLVTIELASGVQHNGAEFWFYAESGDTITAKHGTGNIITKSGGDVTISDALPVGFKYFAALDKYKEI